MRENRHEGLRSWSTALKVAAWIVLILGLIAAVGAIVAGQQGAQEAARRGLETTGTGVLTGGIAGGILSLVMAVVWFLILYVLAEIGDTAADIYNNSRISAASGATVTRASAITEPEPGYSPTRPPAGAPG